MLNPIKDLGNKIKCLGMAYINMQMEPALEGSGRTINTMEKDNINSQTELYMKVNGKII